MNKTFYDVSDNFTIEDCRRYNALGFDCIWNDGKDLTLVDRAKGTQGNKTVIKGKLQGSSMDKSNYSVVCRRCGRRLRSEESRNRGYGSYCYKRAASDINRDTEQVNFMDEIKGEI